MEHEHTRPYDPEWAQAMGLEMKEDKLPPPPRNLANEEVCKTSTLEHEQEMKELGKQTGRKEKRHGW